MECRTSLASECSHGEFHLSVETSALCNLDCVMCSLKDSYFPAGLMRWSTFERVLPAVELADRLDFGFNGECLMHPEFIRMLAEARKRNGRAQLFIVTNCTLLDGRISRALIENGIDYVVASIDAVREDTFARIRRGASLREIIAKVQQLISHREQCGADRPELHANYVVMDCNLEELPPFVDMMSSLGATHIYVNNVEPYNQEMERSRLYSDWEHALYEDPRDIKARVLLQASGGVNAWQCHSAAGHDGMVEENVDEGEFTGVVSDGVLPGWRTGMTKKAMEIFDEARRRAVGQGIELHLPLLEPKDSRRCGFLNPCVSWQGDVTPCAALSYERAYFFFGRPTTYPKVSFGSVLERDFIDIWKCAPYADFRRSVMTGEMRGVCWRCLRRLGIICPV